MIANGPKSTNIATRQNHLMEWSFSVGSGFGSGTDLISHSGMLSCFFQGFSSTFPRSFLNPSAIRRLVECG